jgi:hypothetical protein
MFKDKTKMIGILELSVKGKKVFQEFRPLHFLRKKLGINFWQIPFITGYKTDKAVYRNLIVSAGKAGAASRINGSGAEAAFTYLAVGTGTTAAAAGDTALETEITDSGLARASATASRVTTAVANDTAQLVYTWSVTGSKAITEEGILNAGASGTLLARQVFSAVNVVNGDEFKVTHKVQMS